MFTQSRMLAYTQAMRDVLDRPKRIIGCDILPQSFFPKVREILRALNDEIHRYLNLAYKGDSVADPEFLKLCTCLTNLGCKLDNLSGCKDDCFLEELSRIQWSAKVQVLKKWKWDNPCGAEVYYVPRLGYLGCDANGDLSIANNLVDTIPCYSKMEKDVLGYVYISGTHKDAVLRALHNKVECKLAEWSTVTLRELSIEDLAIYTWPRDLSFRLWYEWQRAL